MDLLLIPKNKYDCGAFFVFDEQEHMGHFRGLFTGLTTIDIQHFISSFPSANKKIKSIPPEIFVGGPATNAAVAFAHLNGSAYLSSATGENPFTSYIEADFHSTQLHHFDLIDKQKFAPVISSVVTAVNNGDRNIFTHHPEIIEPAISAAELFQKTQPDIILADGFYPEFSIECVQLAHTKNIPVVLDCGSWKPQYEEMLHVADFVICSEDFLPPQCTNYAHVFEFMKQKGVEFAAISRGDKSILFVEKNNEGEIKIEQSKVEDTLGAGDFLHGAFCYYWLHSGHFRNALEQASKLASFTCEFKGTRSWLNLSK